MTDNRTTEQTATEQLRALLDERGVEYETDDRNGLRETIWCGTAAFQLSPTAKMTMIVTPEQAIAATLGNERHAYEQRITGDGSDWGEIMRDAYDELMAAACESCTPEQMEQLADYISAELGAAHNTLTAEQVRELIAPHLEARPTFDFWRHGAVWRADFQAIADELNARAERTCSIIEYDEAPYPVCSECGAVQPDDYTVYFCWNCGAKVRNE